MSTAYAVAHVDITKNPPVIFKVGIYSDDAGSLCASMRDRVALLDVASWEADSYATAADRLAYYLKTDPYHTWAGDILQARSTPQDKPPPASLDRQAMSLIENAVWGAAYANAMMTMRTKTTWIAGHPLHMVNGDEPVQAAIKSADEAVLTMRRKLLEVIY